MRDLITGTALIFILGGTFILGVRAGQLSVDKTSPKTEQPCYRHMPDTNIWGLCKDDKKWRYNV